MSTPSLTIRTATSHGAVPAPKRAMRADAVGSSLVTTTASTPKRQRIMSAMPLAWSWSMAITRPPASGSTARIAVSRSWALRSTVGSHWPSSERAVRRRCAARAASRASSKLAATSSPVGATHSISPPTRGKYTGRTTRPSRRASP